MILGFGGASLPELQPVMDFYGAARPAWRRVFAVTPAFPPGPLANAADAQLDEILEKCHGSSHILVHAFSNNGAGALGRLIDKSDGFKKRLRGVLFDSAADMHGDRDMMIDAISGMCKSLFMTGTREGLERAKAVHDPNFGECVKRIVEADDSAVLRVQTLGLEQLCSELPPYCRYLFAHSKEDQLIRKVSIDAFITLLKCFASTPIETLVFEKSPPASTAFGECRESRAGNTRPTRRWW